MLSLTMRLPGTTAFGLQLLRALTAPYGLKESLGQIGWRLRSRTDGFLQLCRGVFEKQREPYFELLSYSGYDFGRLMRLVDEEGLGGALKRLARDGVYLTIREFKQREPVVRRGKVIPFAKQSMELETGPGLRLRSSGSSGRALTSLMGIEGLRLQAAHLPILLDSIDVPELPLVLYYPMPSAAGIVHLLAFTMGGKNAAAWFSQTPFPPLWRSPVGRRLALLQGAARSLGVKLPAPVFSDIGDPHLMATWISSNCPSGAIVATYPGSALRLVRIARERAIRIPELTFLVGGEPLTALKRKSLESEGHRVFPWFGTVETGRIAVPCLRPEHPDEMHVLSDRLHVTAHNRESNNPIGKSGSLLVTTLSKESHKLLLNVETGDSGILAAPGCACIWEELGLETRVHSIRSFEKLNTEGMTLAAEDVASLVDEILPLRCGGTSADYQLAEEEASDGRTRIVVLVSPGIAVEDFEISRVVADVLRDQSSSITPMSELLRRGGSIIVRRQYARATAQGKLLPLRAFERVWTPEA